jgi:streptogramin lyase
MPPRSLPAALLALAAAALTGCTSTVAGRADAAPLSVLGSTTPTSSTAGLVTGVAVIGEETLLLVADPYGGSGLTVVSPATGEVTGEVTLPQDTRADAVLVTDGGTLVAGEYASGYALGRVDPAAGRFGGSVPVAGFPADATDTVAAAAPDGGLLVGVERADGAPVLVRVDPATARVTATADLPVPEGSGVEAVAAAPDGSVVVTAVVPRDDGDTTAAVLLRLDADLAPAGDPVPLLPGEGSASTGLAVGPDGTAYAVVAADSGSAAVVAVAPGADAPETLLPVETAPAELAVVDGELWVLHDRVGLTRVDTDGGTVTGELRLCDDGTADGLGAAADGSLVVVATCARATVWRVAP